MKSIKQNLKKSGIYCIINIKNNKRYIGSSKNIYQRLLKHRSLLRKNKHQNIKLQNSWNKYKENNFDYYILELCKKNKLCKKEQFYIDTLKPELNITLIVERNILSKESRIKQSITRKKRIKSGKIKLATKIIYQYDLQGKFIKSYSSLKEACEKVNISPSTICRHLNGTYKKGGGYLWSYEFKDKLEPYIKPKKKMNKLYKEVQVLNYDTKKFIKKFESVKSCANYYKVFSSSISYYIKNKRKFKNKYLIIFSA